MASGHIFKLLKEIKDLNLDYDSAVKYLTDKGIEVSGIIKEGLDRFFSKIKARNPDHGDVASQIPAKDPVFDDTVIKMQFDERGIPFNPKTLKSTSEKRGVENLFEEKRPRVTDQMELFTETKKLPKVKMGSRIDYDKIAAMEGIDVELIRGKDWSEIMEIISAVRDKADGGRVGYANGGLNLNLSGEAQNIYNSWVNAGHTHQEALDYLASRGMYDSGSGGVENIIGTQQSIIPGAGGGGGSFNVNEPRGPESYTQTWTSEGIPKAFVNDPASVDAFNQKIYDYMGTQMGPFSNDPLRSAYEKYSQKDFIAQNPEYFSQGNVPVERTGVLGMWDKTKNFFSGLGSPKVRGTLGTRLSNQPRLPLPASLAAYSFSPFNEKSRNYNPNIIGQLNYLEGQEGLIGRDQAGHLKYGPESVLAGKNVLSLFGSNDYEKALMDYITKMSSYKKQTDHRKNQIKKAKLELAAFLGKGADDINIEDITTQSKIAKTNKISAGEAAGIMKAIDRDTQQTESRGKAELGSSYDAGTYCFDPNTLVQMADGSEKKIKEIQLGDQTKGGEVTGVFQFKASDEIHDYKGVTVAGSHYVKEDGKFIMVKDSPISVKIDKIPVVYSLDTTGRRIFINDIEFADYNGDGVAKNFLTNAGVDLTGFDTEVLRQVEHRLI